MSTTGSRANIAPEVEETITLTRVRPEDSRANIAPVPDYLRRAMGDIRPPCSGPVYAVGAKLAPAPGAGPLPGGPGTPRANLAPLGGGAPAGGVRPSPSPRYGRANPAIEGPPTARLARYQGEWREPGEGPRHARNATPGPFRPRPSRPGEVVRPVLWFVGTVLIGLIVFVLGMYAVRSTQGREGLPPLNDKGWSCVVESIDNAKCTWSRP